MPGEVQAEYLKKFLLSKSGEAVAQAAQGGGAVTVPEVLKSRVGVALRDVGSGRGGGGLVGRICDFKGLFQPSCFYDSMIKSIRNSFNCLIIEICNDWKIITARADIIET